MWCRVNRHLPIKEQHVALARKLRGHDAYYGITGNARALDALRQLGAPHLAQVAQPAVVEERAGLGAHEHGCSSVSAAAGARRPLHLSRSEPVT